MKNKDDARFKYGVCFSTKRIPIRKRYFKRKEDAKNFIKLLRKKKSLISFYLEERLADPNPGKEGRHGNMCFILSSWAVKTREGF